MNKLSSEIVIDILSRLPIKSLVKCRCICKSWLHLTQELHLIDTHLSISSKNEIFYGLILKSSIPIHTTCWHSKLSFVQRDGTDDYKCVNFNFSLPLLNNYEIMGSCNGLLCLFDPIVKYLTHMLNPCTGEFVFLPNPIRDLEDPVSVVVGFGFLPKRNVYKVVEIVYYKRAIVDDDNDGLRSNVYVYTIGDDSWRCIGSAPYSLRDKYFSGACVNGSLHWVSSGYDGPKLVDQIVGFDLENEVFRVIPHPDFDSGRLNYILGVLQGRLSATRYKFQDYVEIWVMKDYGVKESWTKCVKVVCSEVGLIIGPVQPLFFQRNGELILQHGGSLLSYSPLTKKLSELRISGMPRSFKAVIHVGSLVSPRKLLKCENTEFA
ncbi:F-box protein At3g07870-like [Solanum dulcamara]|uniref:F-box protein At3g07870-like n=1 Tax=Solanum dulcamara TaxID=45834 RepID=UPI0024864F73|nr:F-box protein At3g07870-like [Solanum dulcamara]